MSARPLRLALAGATGAVGRAVLEVLEDQEFPLASLAALSSGRSAGGEVSFRGDALRVEEARAGAFRSCDLALLAVPAEAARLLAPQARAEGCLVVDASAAFREDPEVPLCLPEVNPEAVAALGRGIAAVPCGLATALALALKPIRDAAGLTRVGAVALESVSGAGRRGIVQLEGEALALMNGQEPAPPSAIPYRIAFNLVPDGGARAAAGGAADAELRLAGDLRALLGAGLQVSATVVRVPVFYGHACAVSLTTARPLPAAEARELLRHAEGVKVVDQPAERLYPMPMLSVNDDAVLAGRIREDPTRPNGLELFVSVDNLRRGGATSLVGLARLLARRHLAE